MFFQVNDIAFTFDLFLPIEEDGETGGEGGETQTSGLLWQLSFSGQPVTIGY